MRRYTKVASVIFRERDFKRVKELASRRDVPVSYLLRRVVCDYLGRVEKEEGMVKMT